MPIIGLKITNLTQLTVSTAVTEGVKLTNVKNMA
jgi:hypothetical protein